MAKVAEVVGDIAEGADDNRFPIYPQRRVADIRRALPSAMASHIVYPDRPVVAVYGDGGFMMNS